MALESSALSLKDLSCFQIYDEYTITCLIQLEDVGLCERGAGGRFIESHDLTFRGDVPLNTGGGLLSAGQQSFAGGSTMLIEAIRQLRGEGGERQVKNAKTALVTGLGGLSFGLVPNNTCAAVLGTEDAVR
jgi:acetyl-CoA acetyltransferase